MGKAKKHTLKRRPSKPYSTPAQPNSKLANKLASSKKPTIQANPIIPFNPTDRILLVGEGDFSFSRTLLTHYDCSSLLATTFDSHAVALAKYPQAASNIQTFEAAQAGSQPRILYSVDATKLGTSRTGSGGKIVKKGGFDRIVFNFPHVGGLTKDVHRQIRHNQELLAGFFKAAVPLLATGGTIVVTVFEGEPYDRWELRGLAREAGLKSQRSFRFQSGAYPGYKHARTLGNIGGDGGWKGEERPARSYVLEVDGEMMARRKVAEKERTGATGSNMDPVANKRDAFGKKEGRKGKSVETDSDSDDDD